MPDTSPTRRRPLRAWVRVTPDTTARRGGHTREVMGMKRYEVYDPYTGDETDAAVCETHDAEHAAKDYCECSDMVSGEGYQDRRDVLVREVGAKVWKRYTVTAEPDVTYHAYESGEPAEGGAG